MYYQGLSLILLTLLSASKSWEWGGKIVFEDDFEGTSLNLTKWEYQETCGAEFGPGNLQCYTRNNIQVRNGALIITARKENMEDKQYTSGRLRQRGSGFNYGAFVVRARFARGDHLWPAIWLLPLNSDLCRYEEIDIAEYRGQASKKDQVDMSGHWGRAYNKIRSRSQLTTIRSSDFSQDYHEFAVLWRPSKIEWYVDRAKYFEASLTDGYFLEDKNKLPCRGELTPFTEPTNFILNMAVGGSFFAGYPPLDPNTWTKPTMEIDWVRIYQDD